MVHLHETHDKVVYISPIIYVINDLSTIIEKSSNKGIVCVKRDVNLGDDSSHYPLVLMVLNKDEKTLAAIDNYLYQIMMRYYLVLRTNLMKLDLLMKIQLRRETKNIYRRNNRSSNLFH